MIRVFSNSISKFFVNGHERTLIAKKNIVISFVLKALTIGTGLLLVPMTISYISTAQYGIWLTLSSIIGWFSFFDIGLANGLKNKIAEANAKNETSNIRAYISTTYCLLSAISLILFFGFFISNFYINWNKILNVAPNVSINLRGITLLVFASFCIQFVLQTISSVLSAFHSVAKISLIYTIGQIGCLICVFILIKCSSASLFYLIVVLTGIPLFVQLIATIWYFKNQYKQFIPSFRFVNLTFAKSLLSVGGAFFFVQIGSLLLFQTDNIVVTQLFGPQEVTIFNVTYKLFSVVSMGFTIIMNPFWPAFTDAYAKKDITWIKNIFSKMYKYFLYVIIFCILLLIASPFLFKVWLGNSVQVPFLLSLSMAVYVIGVCWMTIHCYLVNGIGKIKVQFYLYIISTLVNIPLSIYWGKWLGIAGVAMSNILILALMGIVLYVQCRKILKGTAIGIWNA